MKTVLVLTCLLGISLANEIFNYDAVEHKHFQSGEAGAAVEGEYSFTGPDGKNYRITYRADDNGYVAQGDHLPVAPEVPVVEAAAPAETAADPAPEAAPAVVAKSSEEPAAKSEEKPVVPALGYRWFNPFVAPYPYLFKAASDAETKEATAKIQVVQSPFVLVPPSPFVYRIGA